MSTLTTPEISPTAGTPSTIETPSTTETPSTIDTSPTIDTSTIETSTIETTSLPPSPPTSTSEPPITTPLSPTTSELPPPTTSSEAQPPITTPTSTSDADPTTTPSTTSTRAAPPSKTSEPGSTSTVIITTVILTTDLNGHVETQTVLSSQFILPTQSQDSGGGSPSNTAAIAGGVVGGALGLLAIIMAIVFILRQHKRKEEFDGNFDSDGFEPEYFGGEAARPGEMPDIDLARAEVTPFLFHPEVTQQMAQRPDILPPVMSGGSGHGRSDGYSWTTTDQSITSMRNADFRDPSPGTSLRTSGTGTLSSRGRESASSRRRLYVANDERGEGGSGQGGGGVVQHQDGGRLQQESVPEEVPPSYDSISPDEHDATGRS